MRPLLKPSVAQRRAVSVLASVGKTETQIAVEIGISRATLRKHFAEELLHVHAHAVSLNLKLLHKAAENGRLTAMKALDRILDETAEMSRGQWTGASYGVAGAAA